VTDCLKKLLLGRAFSTIDVIALIIIQGFVSEGKLNALVGLLVWLAIYLLSPSDSIDARDLYGKRNS
jgi:hypothetical protein